MFKKKPEGYKELLVYKKAQELQKEVLLFAALFPKTKTFIDLADQISRSARSTTKNIVEGWKRNSTREYFDFLGFSIGSNSELMEDFADIATGVYKELMGIKGIMGERGIRGREELDKLPFYPLDPFFPLVVRLFLQAREANYLLYRLQQSLENKMEIEGTKPQKQKISEYYKQEKQADKEFQEFLKQQGLVRFPNGQYVKKDAP